MSRKRKNEPNKVLTDIRIEKAAAEGNSLAHVDGKVLFVSYSAPGDLADVEVIRQKSGYMQGRIAALKEASEAGVEIVYVDSAANFPGRRLLATDNRAGGKQIGERLIQELTANGITSGMIGIIGVNAATESCNQREYGFRDAFEGTDFTLLETQYCQGDAAQAKDMAANFIAQGCIAVYGANEGSTVGVGNAVMEAGSGVIGCGSDSSDMNLSLVERGALLCIMAQNPYAMGYEGVKSAVEVLSSEMAPEATLDPYYVDTGVEVITKDNLPK